MQISYVYASDFPARQTSRNNNKLIQNSFWLFWLFWEMHKLTGDTRVKSCITFIRIKVRRNANDYAYN